MKIIGGGICPNLKMSPCTFTYYLDLSNFILESGLLYFRVLTICLQLVYFVSAAGCHCFDSSKTREIKNDELSLVSSDSISITFWDI